VGEGAGVGVGLATPARQVGEVGFALATGPLFCLANSACVGTGEPSGAGPLSA
jgi:hypothetical protein